MSGPDFMTWWTFLVGLLCAVASASEVASGCVPFGAALALIGLLFFGMAYAGRVDEREMNGEDGR